MTSYKQINYSQHLPWLTPSMLQQAEHSFAVLKELPRRIPEYVPNLSNLDESYTNKILADISSITSTEMNLLHQEIEIVYKRIVGYDKFNIYDVGFTTGISTLPFILELLQENALKRYIPVTANPYMNEHAINSLKAFTLMSTLPEFKSTSILHEPELAPFRENVQKTEQKDKTVVNLFVMMNSILGNYTNPKQVLRNIYESMGNGDYLSVVQGVYHSGSEDLLVKDYSIMLNSMRDTQDIAKLLNPNAQFKVFWDDREGERGIKISFDIDEPVQLENSVFDTGQSITVLRSRRFGTQELERMFVDVGFTIQSISFDSTGNSSLFFVTKV